MSVTYEEYTYELERTVRATKVNRQRLGRLCPHLDSELLDTIWYNEARAAIYVIKVPPLFTSHGFRLLQFTPATSKIQQLAFAATDTTGSETGTATQQRRRSSKCSSRAAAYYIDFAEKIKAYTRAHWSRSIYVAPVRTAFRMHVLDPSEAVTDVHVSFTALSRLSIDEIADALAENETPYSSWCDAVQTVSVQSSLFHELCWHNYCAPGDLADSIRIYETVNCGACGGWLGRDGFASYAAGLRCCCCGRDYPLVSAAYLMDVARAGYPLPGQAQAVREYAIHHTVSVTDNTWNTAWHTEIVNNSARHFFQRLCNERLTALNEISSAKLRAELEHATRALVNLSLRDLKTPKPVLYALPPSSHKLRGFDDSVFET